MAELADKYSISVPEYYTDYQNLVRECIHLCVTLLDECDKSHEVQTLLTERCGIQKYSKFQEEAKYPRLTMAFESPVASKCKEFVGHRFCQHVLRDSWFEDVSLREASTPYWVFYIILQVLFAPIFIIPYVFVSVGREIGKMDLLCVQNRTENSWLDRWIKTSNNIQLHLDVPLNRHLMHMGYYIIYAALILWTVLDYTYLNYIRECEEPTNLNMNDNVNVCFSLIYPPLKRPITPALSKNH